MKKLMYLIAMLFAIVSCQKDGDYVVIPEEKKDLSALILSLDVDKISSPIKEIYVYGFSTKEKFVGPALMMQKYYSSPEELALDMIFLEEGDYSFIVALNLGTSFELPATKTDLPDLSFNDVIKYVKSREVDFPDASIGAVDVLAIQSEIIRPTNVIMAGIKDLIITLKPEVNLTVNGVVAGDINSPAPVVTVDIFKDNEVVIKITDTQENMTWTAVKLDHDPIFAEIKGFNFAATGTANMDGEVLSVTTPWIVELMEKENAKATVRYTSEDLKQHIDIAYLLPIVSGVIIDEETNLVVSDRNVGVSSTITPGSDKDSYGHYYPWGTKDATTVGMGDNEAGGACANFINGGGGWRLPTREEGGLLWNNLDENSDANLWQIKDVRQNYSNNIVALPLTGYKKTAESELLDGGTYGFYWTSYYSGTGTENRQYLSIGGSPGSFITNTTNLSIRCVRNMPN